MMITLLMLTNRHVQRQFWKQGWRANDVDIDDYNDVDVDNDIDVDINDYNGVVIDDDNDVDAHQQACPKIGLGTVVKMCKDAAGWCPRRPVRRSCRTRSSTKAGSWSPRTFCHRLRYFSFVRAKMYVVYLAGRCKAENAEETWRWYRRSSCPRLWRRASEPACYSRSGWRTRSSQGAWSSSSWRRGSPPGSSARSDRTLRWPGLKVLRSYLWSSFPWSLVIS